MEKISTTSQIFNPVLSNDLSEKSPSNFFGGLISTIFTVGIMIGGVIFVVMLVLGGVQWISSAGDKGQAEAARSKVTTAVIGLVVLFSIYAIVVLVEKVLGVSILNIDTSTLRL